MNKQLCIHLTMHEWMGEKIGWCTSTWRNSWKLIWPIMINRREFNMGISIEHVLMQPLRDSQVKEHLQLLQGNSLAVIRVHFLEFDIGLIQMQFVDTQIIRDFYDHEKMRTKRGNKRKKERRKKRGKDLLTPCFLINLNNGCLLRWLRWWLLCWWLLGWRRLLCWWGLLRWVSLRVSLRRVEALRGISLRRIALWGIALRISLWGICGLSRRTSFPISRFNLHCARLVCFPLSINQFNSRIDKGQNQNENERKCVQIWYPLEIWPTARSSLMLISPHDRRWSFTMASCSKT